MDIILCRNVLMYFSQEIQRRVIKKLHSCLKQEGWLIVSPSETSHQLFREFAADNESGVTFYRKDAACRVPRPEIGDQVPETDFGLTPDLQPPPPAHWLPPPDQAPETDFRPTPDIRPPDPVPLPDFLAEARELYGKGCYAEAIEKILSSPSLPESDAGAMELLARAFANQGRLGEALKWCEKSLTAAKMDPGGHYLLAMILQEQGKLDDAASSLKRALYLDQDFVPALFALGNLTRRQGKSEDSARYFRNAKALLVKRRQDDILPETDGITAGRLIEIIESTTNAEAVS
jgi:chemotaxis protein methyltransferase CheR